MKTIIPAQPGFFAVYPDGGVEPIIAWEITYNRDTCGFDVWPITPAGDAGDGHEVKYIDARGVLHNFEHVVVGGADE